jgi:hypothetical protein
MKTEWLAMNYKMAIISALTAKDPTEVFMHCLMVGFHYGYCKGLNAGHEEALREMLEGK